MQKIKNEWEIVEGIRIDTQESLEQKVSTITSKTNNSNYISRNKSNKEYIYFNNYVSIIIP